ncbi:DUF4238 domain-containing protein [Bradyrhizobium sp. CCBAU 11361]|uniref:DUF4238 domain-containing protein n=1 Tax=Bradyrhizobium sp. CCBAU 11361 TaxID=1630812 RepID=UPI002305046A|nr:DUF4238 domain-containing protein [Bradyrhizobium sp. CCBAU 11361]MDA9491626.1 hypothetical protein [Bradyrhizobium sp. CCBAU 11361]
MKSQITRRQHFVPRFYLAQWENTNGKVIVHDLADDTVEQRNPKNILWEEYYYEEDAAAPDNRIEDILGKMETDAAVVFNTIRSFDDADPGKIADRLKSDLTNDEIQIIRRFAAHQYFRVPGAIDHKRFELQPSGIPDSVKEMELNPGRFVESGVAYLEDAFQKLMILLCVSSGQDYITSDWPCFDIADSDDAPILGEDLGTKPGVAAYFPISPRIAAVFFNPQLPEVSSIAASLLRPRLKTKVQSNSKVVNQNKLVIQQSERFVIAREISSRIFEIASTRKKGRPIKA